MVTPSMSICLTLVIPGRGGGGCLALRPILITISVDLLGLSLKLVSLAQEAMCSISWAIVWLLLDGTKRYVSSAYLCNLLPGVEARRFENEKERRPFADRISGTVRRNLSRDLKFLFMKVADFEAFCR